MSTNAHSSIKGKGFVGYDRLVKLIAGLARAHELSHGYIFFGETGVGKATFAARLANYLEFGTFNLSSTPQSETKIVAPMPGMESIGIDAVREIKYFLSEQPISSAYRTVIVDNAETLTDQAQNALLKVSEEPPPHGLVILIVANPESLLATLRSRFQKIYFPRLSKEEIKKYIKEIFGTSDEEAGRIARYSFGRMGRAIEFLSGGRIISTRREALSLIKTKSAGALTDALQDPRQLDSLLREVVAELAIDPVKNLPTLKEFLKRLTLNAEFNTNKRLQLEAAIWNI